MAKKNNRKPWGDAHALIELKATDEDGEIKSTIIPLGSVWKTEEGNLRLHLDTEPLQWRDPRNRRLVIITKRGDD